MAKFTKKAKATQPENGVIESVEIIRARQFDWGVSFSMKLNGIVINNCTVGLTKNGENFISFPSYKGKDGKWYSYIYFRFSDEDLEKVLDLVAEKVANEK